MFTVLIKYIIMSMNKSTPIVYDGLTLPPYKVFTRGDVSSQMEAVKNLEYYEDDVLLCSFPKSGTHWIWEILNMLLTGNVELSSEQFESYLLESKPEIVTTRRLKRPRVLSTHLLYKYLPQEHISKKTKIVRVIRDPRDTSVSLFHHTNRHKVFNSLAPDFDQFLNNYISDDFPYGGWFKYHIEWEKECEQINENHILTLFYEDCKADEVGTVRKIADFLEVTYPSETLREIAEKCTFQNMSKSKYDTSSKRSLDGRPYIYRKGVVGDWKNDFTSDQAAAFDKIFVHKMKDSNLLTRYGHLHWMKDEIC